MSCVTRVSDDGKYIYQKITGNVNRQNSLQHNLEARKLGQELGIDSFFIDMTEAVNNDSVIDNYDFIYHDLKTMPGFDTRSRVAIVVKPDDNSHDFIETLSHNIGRRVTIFRDEQEAILYLLSEQE